VRVARWPHFVHRRADGAADGQTNSGFVFNHRGDGYYFCHEVLADTCRTWNHVTSDPAGSQFKIFLLSQNLRLRRRSALIQVRRAVDEAER
jgi:hypothetical protein